ncbi:hypothetical protein RN001_007714 [Aquatica leii]|uniref:RanBP-type and C3HC4-type zinc finger-containing protein 1 n=1 Tax=Aquatica leii TaxID=1421715 RepID=A0AAN7SNZ8_9COLE|nr:hypothetical protein RN001_007714 [Aquatica leii]
MSIKHQEPSIAGIGQSPGCDPKASKRSSGLFSFFKWFRPSVSRESVTQEISSSSSCDSLNSISSTGTIASFSFVPASDYKTDVTQKNIVPGPETDTYRARLKQRDKRREHDKNLTLRKKYNLFFHRDTLLKPPPTNLQETDNSKSLPLMTRKTVDDEEKIHRRTNSESSKIKKAGAYCHVKGKRKAPPPPVTKNINEGTSTMSLRRKKRLAPQPPAAVTSEKVLTSLNNIGKYDTIEYADADVIFNDSLKLDHGILKSTKTLESDQEVATNLLSKSPRASYMEPPVSPRPWYKRNLSKDSNVLLKKEEKYEPVERLPDVQYSRHSSAAELYVDDSKGKKKEDKRKSGIAFLTNISELDREASEIIKKEHQNDKDCDMPQFMRLKQEQAKNNTDSWASPKRKSARDLIAKFNAITNVTKVTVNSTFFGARESGVFQKDNFKREYFGKLNENQPKQIKNDFVECQKQKTVAEADKQSNDANVKNPLTKSESAVIKYKDTKLDKKSWYCPKCSLENDYWRIICYVCSTIKPYFDDLTTPPAKINSHTLEKNKTENSEIKLFPPSTNSNSSKNTTSFNLTNNSGIFERNLERSKTQIGFSALAKYNENKDKQRKFVKSISADDKPQQSTSEDKQGEKERLKKMLIEMKNSLPKRKINFEKQGNRASIIQEKAENVEVEENKNNIDDKENIVEVTVATQETIYENIKVKKSDNPKPIKVTASAQTSDVSEKVSMGAIQKQEVNKKFELMRPKDFANIYNVKTEKPNQHIYSNLMENKDLFLNMPMKFNEIKNSLANNTDTLEINRLLKRLETAIARGELIEASNLARELAQLKVNCSVIRQKSVDANEETKEKVGFMVDMYVEDKISHRGPFPINVTEDQTVAQLKIQVEKEFQIPIVVQRWILGKELASDENATLRDLHVTTTGCSIFLYLVAPTNEHKVEKEKIDQEPEILNPINPPSANKPQPEKQENIQIKQETIELLIGLKKDEIPTANAIDIQKTTQNEPQTSTATAAIAQPENCDDLEDYDTQTLKPQHSKTWECLMCTFINSNSTNICAICCTVRINSGKPKSPRSRSKKKAPQPAIQKEQHYLQLLNLDNKELVTNAEKFECLICLTEIDSNEGVTLRECLHQFCKPCLAHTIEFTEDAVVKCPYRDSDYFCDLSLQDREIKALVTTDVYDQFLAKSVAQAENKIDKSFHCKTPDCKGWCIFEDNVNEFHCPVCRRTNCLTCQAIHIGLNCKEYQEQMNESATDEGTKRTREMLEEMVNKGEAIKCPTCHVILMKKWGCDWLRCSMCKTEICWVTRGPRWGPAGKGDTSGGCQCGVNGIKCHPQCNYCH